MICILLQIVLQKSISAVAKKVVPHIRLPLLAPDELKQVEEENVKDKMLPVSESDVKTLAPAKVIKMSYPS